MSAITGLYYRDGRPVDPAELDGMVASLAHRGLDGNAVWRDGSVGLGHLMTRTTPESLHERLPLANSEGNVIITADARIDNREELIDSLGLASRRPPSEIADSELILAAYERWGEDCPTKLLGDFAFAIWDTRRQVLFCVRDHFGVKPFYYYASDSLYAFGTEIRAIHSLKQVPYRPNEVWIGNFLAALPNDTSVTQFCEIHRLPPAHALSVGRDGVRLWQYWALDPTRELRLKSDKEYAAAFREHFSEAVRCRLRSVSPVGALLSGGLDSSSIAVMARELLASTNAGPLHTFSSVYDTIPQCDERDYQNAILAQGGLEHHQTRADLLDPLADIGSTTWHLEGPMWGPGLYATWVRYKAIRVEGIRVLLDGHGGDETVSHGFGRLDELAAIKQWPTFAREALGVARMQHTPLRRALTMTAVLMLDAEIRRYAGRRNVHRALVGIRQRIADSHNHSVGRRYPDSIVKPELVDRIGLSEQALAARRASPLPGQSERSNHHWLVTGENQSFALEILDKATAAVGIDGRYPFWDKRVVEFCLALPSEQKLDRGWSRLILRRAMAGLLPREVQWRADKTDFTPALVRGLLTYDRNHLERLLDNQVSVLESYVDAPTLEGMLRRFLLPASPAAPYEVQSIWRALSLAYWLDSVAGFAQRVQAPCQCAQQSH